MFTDIGVAEFDQTVTTTTQTPLCRVMTVDTYEKNVFLRFADKTITLTLVEALDLAVVINQAIAFQADKLRNRK